MTRVEIFFHGVIDAVAIAAGLYAAWRGLS